MKPKTIKFILVFFNIVMLSSLGWSQCDGCIENISVYWNWDSLGWTDCINWVTNMEDCNEGDISFLQEVTDSIKSLDNESFIEPLQLGSQYWNNGRLENLLLVFFPIDSTLSDIYSTQISLQLPKSIGNLTNLRYLEIMGHFTGELPIEIGNLINLEIFYSSWSTHFGCYEFDYECRSLIENYGDIHSQIGRASCRERV